MDVLVVVIVVSLLREQVGPRMFKAVHWLTYVLWPMSLAHALGNGTDNGTWWLQGLAASCAVGVLAAIAWRLSASYDERGQTRVPRTVQ